ncbi:MAG: T9SS type A sorting domain-containing protein, partial [Bacteroidales bacterium]
SNIASFTAVNAGTSPVVATIVVMPTFNNGGVNCTGPTKSFTITVNPTAQVDQPASQVVCNTAATAAVTFTTTGSGGTVTYAWTNDTPSIGLAASGSGNIASFAAINTGTAPVVATIVVTPSFINGGTSCTGPTKSFTITVNPSGQVIHPESQAVCHGEATAAVVFETLNSGGTTVYTWTNDIPSIGLAAWGTGNIASFIATNTTPGPVVATITVTPTFSNGGVTCYGDAKSFKITVNPLVLVNQPLGQVVCNTAATSAVTFETTNTGGISTYNWTNDTPSIGLAASGTGDIASFTAVNTSALPVVATIVVTPTFTNSGISCTGAAKSFTITVNPTAQVDQPASQVLCNTTATTAISFGTVNSGGTTTYAWTNDTPSIGLAASGTGNIASFTAVNTGTSPVVATIVVIPIFTNGGVNCTGPTKSFTITVNPTAQVDQPANQVLCNTAATTAISFGTVNTGGTTTFEWTNDKPSIGLAASGTGSIASFTAVNTGTSPVVATIVVTPTFNNGGVNCTGPTKSFTITVNPTAQVDQPLDQVLCHSATTDPVTFWTANTGGTATYEWTNDTPSIGLAASGTGNIASFTAVNTGTAPVMATIVVTPTFNNGGVNCTGPTKSFTITVNPLPVPTISGTTNLCVNSGYYIYTTEPGMTNYNWTISPGGSFYWGLGTNELWVTWNTMGAQWVGVTYTNQNSCAAQSATLLNITVSPMPAPAGSITGETTLCAGTQGVVYSTPPIQDAVTYIWNLPPGATIESGDSTTSIVVNYALNAASGNITVYGNNFCGNGPSSSLPVTVNPIPAPPIVTALGDTLTSNAQQGNQWYYSPTQGGSGSAIQGATDPTYLATVTGWYWSQVTLYECVSDTSNHEYVLITGIEEMPGVRFVVYPVPNDGIFMTEITTTDERTFDMQIFDQIGKMIYEKRKIRVQGKFEQKVDLRPIPVGIYTIVFRNEGGLVIRKMLISN